MILKKKAQATLEYTILFIIVLLAIISSNFLWFALSNGKVSAQGQVRDIGQEYFNNMAKQIQE
ncbi:MAG: hypothetical protein ABH882_02060 [Candidatus Omnitrophota bacterium]|nr:hypothetical protein [Candidatus Omnitrophota bacterium]MBU1929566.1 hypothetical protein [Candidatus Omnitrophota bacterium]MBU2035746.1 hypothetical protein [Candidatus Omnitrophota bacterium]MBU2221781.1 hypothetical protein [Candidatus Omnitrophota bacterium]